MHDYFVAWNQFIQTVIFFSNQMGEEIIRDCDDPYKGINRISAINNMNDNNDTEAG